MQFLKILQMVVMLLPTLRDIVKQVDTVFPESDHGAQKLEMVRQLTENAYNAAGETGIAFDKIWPALSGAISGIVLLFKGPSSENK